MKISAIPLIITLIRPRRMIRSDRLAIMTIVKSEILRFYLVSCLIR